MCGGRRRAFPSDAAFDRFRGVGVKYVVVHERLYRFGSLRCDHRGPRRTIGSDSLRTFRPGGRASPRSTRSPPAPFMTDARAAAATTGLLLLLVALTALAVAPAHVNHDAAWYLYVVRHWLDGATLYRDVVDTNPPLIIWLSTPAVWIAALTGWPATALFKAFVFAVAAASLLIVRDIVRRTWPDREFLIVAGAVFVTLPFVKADFGQREHLAVLLTLPYVVAAATPHGQPAPTNSMGDRDGRRARLCDQASLSGCVAGGRDRRPDRIGSQGPSPARAHGRHRDRDRLCGRGRDLHSGVLRCRRSGAARLRRVEFTGSRIAQAP